MQRVEKTSFAVSSINMPNFRVAQKVFIQNAEGKVLVVRFSSDAKVIPHHLHGLWDFPGGGLEYQEKLRDGLFREIHEELGDVEITIGKPLVVWTFTLQGKNTYCVAIGYDARWISGTICLNEEHDRFQWMEPKALLNLSWDHFDRKAIEEYVALRQGNV